MGRRSVQRSVRWMGKVRAGQTAAYRQCAAAATHRGPAIRQTRLPELSARAVQLAVNLTAVLHPDAEPL